MRLTAVQVAIIVAVAAGGAWLIVSNAKGWADWVVFGAIVATGYGFAVAVSPKLYARRNRTISRESPPPRR